MPELLIQYLADVIYMNTWFENKNVVLCQIIGQEGNYIRSSI